MEEVKETVVTKKKPKEKFEIKTVKIISKNESMKYVCIDFEGFGIKIDCETIPSGEFIDVKFKGKIGHKDFVCELK